MLDAQSELPIACAPKGPKFDDLSLAFSFELISSKQLSALVVAFEASEGPGQTFAVAGGLPHRVTRQTDVTCETGQT